MSDAYKSSLIGKTNPEPYEQIIVVCQKMINDAFTNMWSVSQLIDPNSSLVHFKQSFRSGDKIEVDLGPPEVQLQIVPQDPQLYYLLKMENGSLFLYTTEDANNNAHIEWSIKNWVFAFSVKIGEKKIAKNSPEYSKYKERAGLPESNFSLAQLFIDSSSTTKWNEALSTFGDKQNDWNSLELTARATFVTFISKWLNAMQQENKNILGYSAQAEKSENSQLNKYAPSFPPTSIDYSNYPWLDPSSESSERKNNIDQNAISYLMMGSFNNPPLPVGLPYSGAFVKDNGLYCMNRKIFWDSWLLKQLGKVLKMMELVPDEPVVVYNSSNPDYPWQDGVRLHVGNNSDPDSDYFFQKFDPSSPHRWVGKSRVEKKKVDGDDDDHGFLNETTQSFGDYDFGEGHETVTMIGENVIVIFCGHKHGSRDGRWTQFNVTSNWKFQIAMAAAEDGGIAFKEVPKSKSFTVTPSKPEGPLQWEHGVQAVVDMVTDALKDQLQKALSSVEDDLLHALANQQKLFLPAAGTFLMKDPTFNHRGDLIVTLTYNGADPPSKPRKPTPAPLVSAQASKPIAIDFTMSNTHIKLASA